MKRTGRWQDWAILILGVWLLLSPVILGYAPLAAAAWNAYVVGAAVVILACTSLWVPSFGMDEEWGNLALGLWLVAAPFVLGFYGDNSLAAWNQIAVGVLIAADAGWVVASRSSAKQTQA